MATTRSQVLAHLIGTVLGQDKSSGLALALNKENVTTLTDLMSLSDYDIETLMYNGIDKDRKNMNPKNVPLLPRRLLRILQSYIHYQTSEGVTDYLALTKADYDDYRSFVFNPKAPHVPPSNAFNPWTPSRKHTYSTFLGPNANIEETSSVSSSEVLLTHATEKCLLNKNVCIKLESDSLSPSHVSPPDPLTNNVIIPFKDDTLVASDTDLYFLDVGENVASDDSYIDTIIITSDKQNEKSNSSSYLGPDQNVSCKDNLNRVAVGEYIQSDDKISTIAIPPDNLRKSPPYIVEEIGYIDLNSDITPSYVPNKSELTECSLSINTKGEMRTCQVVHQKVVPPIDLDLDIKDEDNLNITDVITFSNIDSEYKKSSTSFDTDNEDQVSDVLSDFDSYTITKSPKDISKDLDTIASNVDMFVEDAGSIQEFYEIASEVYRTLDNVVVDLRATDVELQIHQKLDNTANLENARTSNDSPSIECLKDPPNIYGNACDSNYYNPINNDMNSAATTVDGNHLDEESTTYIGTCDCKYCNSITHTLHTQTTSLDGSYPNRETPIVFSYSYPVIVTLPLPPPQPPPINFNIIDKVLPILFNIPKATKCTKVMIIHYSKKAFSYLYSQEIKDKIEYD